LVAFYGQIGFAVVDPEATPVFLAERLAEYRKSGEDVILMRRR
jgi:hypothetical protein